MDPLTMMTAATIISQLGGAVMDFTGKAKQAKKQQEYYDQYKAENTRAIKEDLTNNENLLLLQQQQEEESSSFNTTQAWLKNRQAQASAEVSALEGGVGGNTLQSLMDGYDKATAVNDYVSAKNLEMKGMQLNQNIKALKAKAQSAINLAEPYSQSSIIKPSIGANLLSGLGGAMSTAGDANRLATQDKYYKSITRT